MRGASILAAAVVVAMVAATTPTTQGEETSETSEPPSITLTIGGPAAVHTVAGRGNVIEPGESLAERQEREAREAEAARQEQARKREVLARERRVGNGYTYGYCTYYVASVKQVPGNWGNARNWLVNASETAGYSVTETPEVGAIVVTAESRLGHVALVRAVSNGQILISEMNAIGWNKVSTRWLPIDSTVIRGYII